nr:hypothetical protein [uncultured Brevundimonas sp.]
MRLQAASGRPIAPSCEHGDDADDVAPTPAQPSEDLAPVGEDNHDIADGDGFRRRQAHTGAEHIELFQPHLHGLCRIEVQRAGQRAVAPLQDATIWRGDGVANESHLQRTVEGALKGLR